MTVERSIVLRVLCALIVYAIFGGAVLYPAHAQDFLINSPEPPQTDTIPFIERAEDERFILEVVADETTILHEGILAFIDGDTVMVPLSQMMEILQFQIKTDIAAGRAQGWFIREENDFALAYPFESVTIAGEKRPFTGRVEVHIDDLYVGIDALSQWFPIEVLLNYNELRLYVRSGENLPFRVVAERRSRWEKLRQRDEAPHEEDDSDVIVPPYKNFAMPAVQISQGVSHNRVRNGGSQTVLSNTVQAYGDVLQHTARLSATHLKTFGDGGGPSDGFGNVLFNMSREDFRGNLLGFMDATAYELGDISTFSFPLASGQQRGRGARVTNAPPNYVRDPSRFVVEGYAADGWDVELYQDDRLVNFQPVDAEGRYRFENIDLREGFNLFRVALYGPNGEREDRFESFFLGQDMVAPGQFIYEISALESASPLFNLDDMPDTDPLVSLMGEYGISRHLSAYAGLFTGPLSGGETEGVGAGLRLSLGRTYSQLSLYKDMDDGYSASINVTGNLTPTLSWAAGHTMHDGYDADERSVIRETFARFSKLFSFKLLPQSNISLEAREEESAYNVRTHRIINRFSTSFRGLNISHDLEYSRIESAADNTMDGALTISKRLGDGVLRGRLNYDLQPERELKSGEVQYQMNLSDVSTLSFGLITEMTGQRISTFRTTWDRRFEKLRLGLSGSVNTEEDINLGVNLTYHFVPRKQFGDYRMTGSASSLSSGLVQIRPFIDENGNQTYDDGEQVPEGVAFRNAQRGTEAVTQDDGIAYLDGIGVNSINRISMDVTSLPDIYMMPARESVRVFGKTGTFGPIDYPIQLLGEVTGTVDRRDDTGSLVSATGIEMMLVDEQGKVIAQTFSEYDGFFIFSAVPMGRYTIDLPRGKRHAGPDVVLAPGRAVVNDLEMVLDGTVLYIQKN